MGAPLPDDILDAPLRPAQPPMPLLTPGSVFCANGCKTKGGQRKQGCQTCIEHKCKSCCENAAADARDHNLPRDPCKAHKVLAVSDILTPPPLRQPVPRQHVQHAPALGSESPPSSPSLTPRPPSPTASARPTLSQPRTQPSSSTTNRRRPLAQPIGPNWVAAKIAADEERASIETLKVRRQQMEEMAKKTCEFVIYHKRGAAPIEMKREIDSYPRLKISELFADLMTAYTLTPKSLFDHWDSSHWVVITAETPIMVEKGRETLLRFRPSFADEFSLEDCPGITDKLARQPRAVGTKRSQAIQLVSPLKKAAKSSASMSIPSSSSSSMVDLTTASSPAAITPSEQPKVEPSSQDIIANTPGLTVVEGIAMVKTYHELPLASWEAGWNKLNKLVADNPREVTQKSGFPQVFGFPYSKTSVTDYKKGWRDAPKDLRDRYVRMGNIRAASWHEFNKAVRSWGRTGNSSGIVDLSVDSDTEDVKMPTPSSVPDSMPPHSPSSALRVPAAATATSRTVAAPMTMSTPLVLASPPKAIPAITSAPGRTAFPSLSPLLPGASLPPLPSMDNPMVSSALADVICDYGSASDDEEDGIDHGSLCPFCDEPLPLTPSPKLRDQLVSLEKQSKLDPMPDNRFHRKTTTFKVFVDFCQRHKFESEQLPSARLAGWPNSPDFARLFDRVVANHPSLADVSRNTHNTFFEDAKLFYKTAATRLQSASSQCSTSRFVKFGAGYYGELGYQLIYITLQNLYPSWTIECTCIAPLTYDTFVREVLVPEVTTRLIQDDLHVSRSEAIKTLHASHAFGFFLHPVDDNCPLTEAAMRRGIALRRTAEERAMKEEYQVKREEMDLDLEAETPLDNQTISYGGAGVDGDPIDLTSD
ncbi:hypothetical protein FPV67DRAFT_1173441 [Lyophyllum atratum]|nr:hypothetical protein FPV67DRAFT_1173441 [Lyophyllum atratum]